MSQIHSIMKRSFVTAAALMVGGCEMPTVGAGIGACIGDAMITFMKQNTPQTVGPYKPLVVKPVIYHLTHTETGNSFYKVAYPKVYFSENNGKNHCVEFTTWDGSVKGALVPVGGEPEAGRYCTPDPHHDKPRQYFLGYTCKVV